MKRTTQRIFLWTGLVLVLGLIGWGLYAASQGSGSTATAGSVPPMSAADHVLGSRTSKAVLIEYGDFECPACAAYQPIVTQLKDKYGDALALVFREYPLTQLHKYAMLAAQAAEAADKQGQFWAMHDLLYQRQNSWVSSLDARPVLIGYAQELGLNVSQFTTDLDSAAVKARIQTDISSGSAANVPGTPTFFFNGKQVVTTGNMTDFTNLIDAVIQPTNTNA